ncbi:MAG: DUF4402 domain-containing protein [Bacteroidota bacterium]|nr:DUF4402 domain-containing protein [Bacteroidota bacterium]
MKVLKKHPCYWNLWLTILIFFLFTNSSTAQPSLPQRTLTLTATQAIHFGTVCVGSIGGTVTVDHNGTRTSSDLILLNIAPYAQPAIFEIKLCQGRNVSISFDSSIMLNGEHGGTLTMDKIETDKGTNGARFTTNSDCNFITPVRVGGTLHIPGNAIPGNYSGFMSITINQQ